MRGLAIEHETIQTSHRNEMIDVTARVSELVRKSGLASGMAIVFVAHTTAAITINENADPAVKADVLRKLEA